MRIAIVEDTERDRKLLQAAIMRYSAETGQLIQTESFENAQIFLDRYKAVYDVVFMDILLPLASGMEAAERLRQIDRSVALIFVTDMAQYAIQGYRVGAIDYFLKPVNYYDLKMRMDMIALSCRRDSQTITVHLPHDGERRLPLADVYFIEVMNRDLTWHTVGGDLTERRTLKSLESELKDCGFYRCSASYLVNLQYCTGISGDMLTVAGHELKISRGMREEFMNHLSEIFPTGMNRKKQKGGDNGWNS